MNIRNRLRCDRGDSNSISMLLWIVFVVVLVLTVGKLIFDATTSKTENVAKCIEDSNTIFGSSGNCK